MKKAVEAIRISKSFLLTTHRNPDGDAIGSELALAMALWKMGKTATIKNLHAVPGNLMFLPYVNKIHQTCKVGECYDIAVLIDCENLERCGNIFSSENYKTALINIDHHISNQNGSDYDIVNSCSSSTAEMVYRIIKELDVEIDKEISTCLFTGIFADTGGFRYSNSTPAAFEIASELMNYNIDPLEISLNLYESKSFQSQKLLGLVLNNLEISNDNKISWLTLTKDFFKKTGTSPSDAEGFINFAREIKSVEVALMFREIGESKVKVSFRSKGSINVAEIAKNFGGGGHKNAAGCVMDGSMKEVQDMVIGSIKIPVSEN
ncbi:MAG: hypothetical protein A2042_08385 [Candidatus Schekmanbacteria bacterium GWA2_38_11]|uniref:DDH domain-containing protein n=1 Tax=Candidatus Schekmanbacteria bacterium GWA2_38_11 TaxID=1817876 RepID=A0A1F7RDL7_9BACT|nr:MAG: hypothetical protein A2042_08385 [Candidatus Schekmanbacteria bacterium GWA2_38_11]